MEEGFRDRIATVNEDGKRIWVFPKKTTGKLFRYRKILSYSFLAFLFAAPHIQLNGKQLLLFNILERKFIIFGYVFWPQDFWIFALIMILGIIIVTLFTVVFGRVFCGWICPQTIFMEWVFRRIEYWIDGDAPQQRKLMAQKWNAEKIRKRLLKHTIFWIISFLIANTFLAYIIGSSELYAIQRDPISYHIGGLVSIIIFTTVFYIVFSRLREQVCTTICPYGRLQGVLLDANSMVVGYDYKRGEGRAKIRKGEDRKESGKGDCIDCKACVNVCPTGIDIRNGTQLECINCTLCIDACNHMMKAVNLPENLIGFKSENSILNGVKFEFTKRVRAYCMLMLLLVGIVFVAMFTRKDFQTTILRLRGTTYTIQDGYVTNFFEVNLVNKTAKEYDVTLKFDGDTKATVELIVENLELPNEGKLKERFIVRVPLTELQEGKIKRNLVIYGNGKVIDHEMIKIIGPIY